MSRKNLVQNKKCSTSARRPIIKKERIQLKSKSKSDSRIDEKSISSKESVSRRYKISPICGLNIIEDAARKILNFYCPI